MDVFVELMKGLLFGALALAFLLLAFVFLRLAGIFSTARRSIEELSEQVVPLVGKTHVTVDNINSQLTQLDSAVGDVAGITGELDQTTTVITRGVRGGVINLSSATAGLSRGISAFFGTGVAPAGRPGDPSSLAEKPGGDNPLADGGAGERPGGEG